MKCLLRGTDWVFKSAGYSFVLRGLISASDCHELHVPAALPPGKKRRHPLERGCVRSRGGWTVYEATKSLSFAGTRNPNHPSRSLVTIPTELPRFLLMKIHNSNVIYLGGRSSLMITHDANIDGFRRGINCCAKSQSERAPALARNSDSSSLTTDVAGFWVSRVKDSNYYRNTRTI